MMRDYHAFRHATVLYWERRRVLFNVSLLLPAFLGYIIPAGLFAGVGDIEQFGIGTVILLFLLAAVGANICYSFAYALEFLFGSDEPSSRWLRFWRTMIFIGGTLFSMVIAFFGGRNIALAEYLFR